MLTVQGDEEGKLFDNQVASCMHEAMQVVGETQHPTPIAQRIKDGCEDDAME